MLSPFSCWTVFTRKPLLPVFTAEAGSARLPGTLAAFRMLKVLVASYCCAPAVKRTITVWLPAAKFAAGL